MQKIKVSSIHNYQVKRILNTEDSKVHIWIKKEKIFFKTLLPYK